MTAWILFGLAAAVAAVLAFLLLAERSLRRDSDERAADLRHVCECVRLGLPMDRRELQLASYVLGEPALRDWREQVAARKGGAR